MAHTTIKILLIAALFALIGMQRAQVVWTEWAAPTTNTDGTPLTDLAGYKIYIVSPQASPTPVGIYKVIKDYKNTPILTIGPEHTKWPFIVDRYEAYQVQISAFNSRGKESSKTPLIFMVGK